MNPGPPVPQTGALTGLRYAPPTAHVYDASAQGARAGHRTGAAAYHCCVIPGLPEKRCFIQRHGRRQKLVYPPVQRYMDENLNAPITEYIDFAPNFVVNYRENYFSQGIANDDIMSSIVRWFFLAASVCKARAIPFRQE